MPRPRPPARCDHVRGGARPHFAKGFCQSCYRAHQYVAHKVGAQLSADDTPFTACPVRYCPRCGRRIGDGCPRCAPDWSWLLTPEERAPAAWVAGALADDPTLAWGDLIVAARLALQAVFAFRRGWRVPVWLGTLTTS